jgi:hypothetical protein
MVHCKCINIQGFIQGQSIMVLNITSLDKNVQNAVLKLFKDASENQLADTFTNGFVLALFEKNQKAFDRLVTINGVFKFERECYTCGLQSVDPYTN